MKIDVITISFNGKSSRPDVNVSLKDPGLLITVLDTESKSLLDPISVIMQHMHKRDFVTLRFSVDTDTYKYKLKAKFNFLCSFKCRYTTIQAMDIINDGLVKIFRKFLQINNEDA